MKKRSLLAFLILGTFAAYRKLKAGRDIQELAEHMAVDLKRVGLTPQVFSVLPRSGENADGKPMEWMNLIIAADTMKLKAALEKAGWYEADPISLWSLLRSLYAILTKGQYLRGPFTPIYVNNKAQDLSYQKPDETNTFARRHHARLWRTDQVDKKGMPLWIGHISFDNGIKSAGLMIVHTIDPDIDADREYIVGDMLKVGAKLRDHIQFQPAGRDINGYGDPIKSDGRAAVLEVK